MLFFVFLWKCFFTMYLNSHLSLKKIDYCKMFHTGKYVKICHDYICINTGSVCPLLSCPLSNDKCIYTCKTYYKYKNINYKNYHDLSYKCKAIDINSTQYLLIHIIITHHSNMHVYMEMYMIIITIIISICIMHKKYKNMFHFTHTVRYLFIIFMFMCFKVTFSSILKNWKYYS